MCYTYDSLGRVTKRTKKNLSNVVLSEESFAYDAAGNVTDAPDSSFQYDTNNRLISFNGNNVSYDLDGNMLSNGSLSCTYDSANRLVSAGGHTYTYNAEDVRIRNLCPCSEDTTYTYNTNAKLSMLLMKTTCGVVTKYVYGRGLIGEEVSSAFKTYHFDCRGSTIAITNASGNITDTFAYDTYGKLLSGMVMGGIGGAMNPSFCFVAGTAVLTTLGKKAIETIQVGDVIPCVDHITGETAEKRVVSTTVNKVNRLIELDIDGEIIQCTETHPFHVKNTGWVDACNLNPGDVVYTKDWNTATVNSVNLLELDEPVEVFNFEVEDCHTYFVGENYILVHNATCTQETLPRKDAVKKGKDFLGDNYTKVKKGYYKSSDGHRVMRFDTTHHGGTPTHINLETWKNPVSTGVRNKLQTNHHIFFDYYG